jgi:hypothetical protein
VYAGIDALMRRHADDADAAEHALGELVGAADGLPGPTYDELPTGTIAARDPVVARLQLPTFDVAAADVSRHQPTVEVPAFNVGGWFDVFLQGTIDNFVNGGPQDRLVIGPWNHMSSLAQQGELNFGIAGSGAAVDLGPSINRPRACPIARNEAAGDHRVADRPDHRSDPRQAHHDVIEAEPFGAERPRQDGLQNEAEQRSPGPRGKQDEGGADNAPERLERYGGEAAHRPLSAARVSRCRSRAL